MARGRRSGRFPGREPLAGATPAPKARSGVGVAYEDGKQPRSRCFAVVSGERRPFLADVVGYLLALFSDPEEAQRAQRALKDQGVPEGDVRLYDSEEINRIASRLQQEQSFLAKAINEVVVDRQIRERWAAAAREGGSHLWVYAPTRERATRLVGLLADCHYELLHYLGEGGVETVEGAVGSTLTDQRNGWQDPDDRSDQH